MLPIGVGVIEYQSLDKTDGFYYPFLLGVLLCFCFGYQLFNLAFPYVNLSHWTVGEKNIHKQLWLIKTLTIVGCVGSLMQVFDIVGSGVSAVSGMADARQQYASRVVGFAAQLGAILSWGSLYATVFIVSTFRVFGPTWRTITIISLLAFAAVGFASAGRQAVFQLLLLMGVSYFFDSRNGGAKTSSKSRLAVLILGFILGVSYMGYVAWARNDGLISDDKIEVLRYYFNFEISSIFSDFIKQMPSVVSTGIIEGLVYFTHSVPLFGEFFGINFESHYWGAFSFPFIFRRIEGLAGFSVMDVMLQRSAILDANGVMPVAWYTAFSSFVSDFGVLSCFPVTFIWGALAAAAWRRYRLRDDAQSRVFVACILLSIVYMPLSLVTADTNLLLLFIFSAIPAKYMSFAKLVKNK